MDVTETDKEIEITAELPGLEEKDVQINVADNLLTVRGEKKAEKEEQDKNYRLIERSYGSFQRTLELPDGCNADAIKASIAKGAAALVLMSREEAEQRGENPAHERQQQHDAGQGHAALAGEELGHRPRRPGNQHARERRRPVEVGRERLPDRRHREQDHGCGDGDEDVVEAGDEAEMFLVARGRGLARGNVRAQRIGGLGSQRAGGDRVLQVLVGIHGTLPVMRGRVPEVC